MIDVVDDGTLDTMLRCAECGQEFRYNWLDDAAEHSYEDFLAWAVQDVTDTHDCYNPEREEED